VIDKCLTKTFLYQYFILVEEKSGCLLCSVSTLVIALQSLVLRLLSVALLYLLMCPLKALDYLGVIWGGGACCRVRQLLE
jgi:hypothetical protein